MGEVSISVSAQLIRKSKFGILYLLYVLVWLIIWPLRSENVRRLIRLRKKSAHQQLWKAFFYHMKQRGEQTMQGLPTSLICRLFVCLVIGSYLLIALNVIFNLARNKDHFTEHGYQILSYFLVFSHLYNHWGEQKLRILDVLIGYLLALNWDPGIETCPELVFTQLLQQTNDTTSRNRYPCNKSLRTWQPFPLRCKHGVR